MWNCFGQCEHAGIVNIGSGSSLSASYRLVRRWKWRLRPDGRIYRGQRCVERAVGCQYYGRQFGGGGTVNGRVFNSGTVAPGDPQTLTVNGNYWQDPTGQLVIDIAGANSFDILDVNGNVTLGGEVVFNFLNGYVPTANTRFSFLQTNAL